MPNDQGVLLLAVGFSAFAAGGLIFRWMARALTRLRLARRFSKGQRGEHEAKAFLKKKGFSIEAEQVQAKGTFSVDDRRVEYKVRADYLVSRNGRSAVVEVKTGPKATNARYRPTRRQLLEYSSLFDTDDLFLFNADQQELQRICFAEDWPRSIHPSRRYQIALHSGLLGLVAGLLIGGCLAFQLFS